MLAYPELTQAGKELLAAADYIEQHGWCQYICTDINSRVCILGAFIHSDLEQYKKITGDWEVYYPGIKALNEALESEPLVSMYKGSTRVIRWNDLFNQTKENVINKLREVAYSCIKE